MIKTIREFHVSRKARDTYHFSDSLFTLSGNVIFTNFLAARAFAQKMNDRRDLMLYPESAIRAGALIAMGLIDEILHYMVSVYGESLRKDVMARALSHLEAEFGPGETARVLRQFSDEFPPLAVYQRKMTLDEYLSGQTGETPNRQIVLEEMLLLWLANRIPPSPPLPSFSTTLPSRERPRF